MYWQLGCVAGAIGLPPSRTDIGSRAATVNGQTTPTMKLSSGAHWASGTRTRKVGFDFGGGVVYERSDAVANTAKAGTSIIKQDLGGYLEGSRRIHASPLTRTWLGARAEVLRDLGTRGVTMSLAGRVSWELYGGVSGGGADSTGKGFAMILGHGTFAIGSYVESGVRMTPDSQAEFLLSAGLSVRMPGWILMGVGFK